MRPAQEAMAWHHRTKATATDLMAEMATASTEIKYHKMVMGSAISHKNHNKRHNSNNHLSELFPM